MTVVGFVGMGFVGTRLEEELRSSVSSTVTFDIRDGIEQYPPQMKDCDLVMVCVDTPAKPDGSANTAAVRDAVQQCPAKRILIRSTVPPGTTDEIRRSNPTKTIGFMPEFVGETNYIGSDWGSISARAGYIIIGAPKHARQEFLDILTPIYGPNTQVHQCESIEAEITKYMENAYFATKVIFTSEFYDICRKTGADWHAVRSGWLLDDRVERDHTAVFPNDRGFSGKCLPKDLSAIRHFASTVGVETKLLDATWNVNRTLRAEGHSNQRRDDY